MCTKCPANYYFTETNHTCQVVIGEHCSGGRYETFEGLCVCRSWSPYWDGSNCIQCEIPNYFDFDTQKCLSCPPGHYFNGQQCAPTNCSDTQTFDIQTETCVCPWYSPLWKDGACQPCQNDQIYHSKSQSCVFCPLDSSISPDNTSCLCHSEYQVFNWENIKCQCPYWAPVFNPDTAKC